MRFLTDTATLLEVLLLHRLYQAQAQYFVLSEAETDVLEVYEHFMPHDQMNAQDGIRECENWVTQYMLSYRARNGYNRYFDAFYMWAQVFPITHM